MSERTAHLDGAAAEAERLPALQRALLGLKRTRALLEKVEGAQREPIAVVGIGCRFPGAEGPQAFWRLLVEGVDAIREVPADRWDVDSHFDPDPAAPGKMYTRWGGFLSGIDGFDAGFFGISPREAASLDPQQRLLLEVSWQALENAGYAADGLAGSNAGVFVGISNSDYLQIQYQVPDPTRIDAYFGTGNAFSAAAGRLSHYFGLKGPSLAVDTACSSSLVAVHLACRSLRSGETDLALAGGVNVILSPLVTIAFCRARMMAADGRCKTFAADADGYVRGEGCGVLVLKRLCDARAQGDAILAVLRGSAVNQDGQSGGLTVPHGPAQRALIEGALASAGVAAAEVGYVEAHGTGTALGDPIEAQALSAALRPCRGEAAPLAIGSVKTNIGHLESAAGVAGLIKVILMLQHRELPPHLHLREVNPRIPLADLHLTIPTVRSPFPAANGRRIAGVSSFGFSGTNAHVLVEEAPEPPPAGEAGERPLHLLGLSARSEPTLRELAGRFAEHLGGTPPPALSDVCFTANTGRSHLPERLALIAGSATAARQGLAAFAAGSAVPGLLSGRAREAGGPKLAFLFTGQGSQYVGMAQQLHATEPVFRDTLNRCAELLHPYLEQPLLSVLYPAPGMASPLDETIYAQPALFAVEVALAALWRSWGIEPFAVLGHSIGEYAAACVAGVFSLEDGVRLVAERGRLVQGLPRDGEMAAVSLDEGSVAEAIAGTAGEVAIAAVNGPRATVIAGRRGALSAVLEGLAARGTAWRPMKVSHAFHSPLIEPILDAFERVAGEIRCAAPGVALISNLSGRRFAPGEAPDARYWRRHLREPVRFSAGVLALVELGCTAFLEIGPAPTLSALGKRCHGTGKWLASLSPGKGDWQRLLETAAALYVQGQELDWHGFHRQHAGRRIAVPNYPFMRQRFWFQPAASGLGPRPAALEPGRLQVGAEPLADLAPPAEERAPEDCLFEVAWHPWSRLDRPAPRPQVSLPSPSGLAPRLETQFAQLMVGALPGTGAAPAHARLADELDRLSASYAADSLRQLGWAPALGEPVDAAAAAAELGVIPRYSRLLARLPEIVEEAGAGGGEPEPPELHLGRLAGSYPGFNAVWTLLGRCGPRLAEVLRGHADPLELLFPAGRLDTAEALYHDSPAARFSNTLAQETVEAVLAALPAGRVLRVLEVGGGTGATTAHLLARLPAERVEYVFTDVSRRFLAEAEQRFAHFPSFRCQILDIESDPQAQGLAPRQFDLVVAANVLHATADLRRTVSHVAHLLAPGGLLLALEGIRRQGWMDLVFGLTEGFWRFTDLDLRPSHPLLSAPRWKELFTAAGFIDVAVIPEREAGEVPLGQAVLLAACPRAQPSPEGLPEAFPQGQGHGAWLIFTDDGGIGQRFAERLRAQGVGCILAVPGEAFEPMAGGSFRVRPGSGEDLRRLLAASRSEQAPLAGVLHLWSLGADEGPVNRATLEQAHLLGPGTVLRWVEELAGHGGPEPPRLVLVTRGVEAVGGAPEISALPQAALRGVGRGLAHDHPGLSVTLVDLDPASPAGPAAAVLAQEIASLDRDAEVAFRDGQRFVPRLVAAGSRPAPGTAIRWRTAGTYAISGGLTALGLTLARWMVEGGARRLLLLDSVELPPRIGWSRLGEDHPQAAEVLAIRALEAAGASVHLAALAGNDEAQMASFLDRFEQEGWPPLRGVISTGLDSGGMAADGAGAAALGQALVARNRAAWILDRRLAGAALDFLVFFSSADAWLGGAPPVAAGAAAFLDALARAGRAAGRPVQTIGWATPSWAGLVPWPGRERPRFPGCRELAPDEALRALERSIEEGREQSLVLALDAAELARRPVPGVEPAALAWWLRQQAGARLAGAAAGAELCRSTLFAAAPWQRQQLLTAHLAVRVARVLGLRVAEVDVDQPLNSLGLDSLMAVELKNLIETDLGQVISLVKFLQAASLAELAAQVLARLEGEAVMPQLLLARSGRTSGEHPLSYGQRALWFLYQLAPKSAAYNLVFAAHVRSAVEPEALRRSFQYLVDRHAALRTTFHLRDGKPVAWVHDRREVRFEHRDASAWSDREAAEHLSAEVHRPFDLEAGPVIRIDLISRAASEHLLLLVVHHIAIDFWSLVLLVEELGELYAAEIADRPAALPPLDLHYADYARWQGEMLASAHGQRLWEFWRQRLGGELPVLRLPTDRPRPPVQSYRGASQPFGIEEGLAHSLRSLAAGERTTLYTTVLAAFLLLLHRYSGQQDLLLGSPATGRSRAELEPIVGYFVNPVVLRASLSGDPPFRELLAQVSATVLAALEHEEAPFPFLVERLRPQRDPEESPLFQVMFNMLQPRRREEQGVSRFFMGQGGARMSLGGLEIESFSVEQRTAMFDLTLTLVDVGGGLSAHWQHNTDLFDGVTIARMAAQFHRLLEGLAAAPGARLATHGLLAAGERHQVCNEWNDAAGLPPGPGSVHRRFERQAAERADAVALTWADGALTYRELDRRADRLAGKLAQAGAGPERLVALLVERGPGFVAAVLAVFKAGGAYLPLDPLHPPSRIGQVLAQSQVSLALVDRRSGPLLFAALREMGKAHLPLTLEIEALLADGRGEDMALHSPVGELAYVIFTSGSTGVPKGAMVEQAGMLNHLEAKIDALGLSSADCVAQNASQCFDISVWQILAPLLVGGRVRVVADEEALDPERLLAAVEHDQVTVLEVVPSQLRALCQQATAGAAAGRPPLALRWLISTGEALPADLCRQCGERFPGVPMLNAYGPTECSDDVTHGSVRSPPAAGAAHIPLGRPLPNLRLYAIGPALELQPPGVTGELCVGGVGVGRGYLGDASHTAQAFIPDPFSGAAGARLYRTGDLVRQRAEGCWEFLGRTDFQVKIRGFRIELGEVEAALERLPGVRQAIVLAQPDGLGAQRLAAYVQPGVAPPPAVEELRGALKRTLPEPMVPSVFSYLDAIPLTANGKVDREALPALSRTQPELRRAFGAPRTPTETRLAAIWGEVLGVERVGVFDNFFDLGGHSLMAVQLLSRVREAFPLELPLRSLFADPNVAALAGLIDAVTRGEADLAEEAISLADLAAEAVPEPAITPAATLRPAAASPASVLLTGATGFLGSFLLSSLLERSQLKVYCLVRARDAEQGRRRLARSLEALSLGQHAEDPRIVPVPGDLALPLLGLESERFDELAEEVDAIYHNGAWISHLLPYPTLKPANVLGTRAVLRLACQAKVKPVHYISTLAVFPLARRGEVRVVREDDDLDHGGPLHGGYAQSKWVAEKLIAAAGSRGVPVSIYRPGMITGHATTGAWNTDNALCTVMKSCIQLGYAPDVDSLIDLTPVDYVSQAITRLSLEPEAIGKVFHLANPHPVPFRTLMAWIGAFGYPLEIIPYEEWLGKLIEHAGELSDNALTPYLPVLAEVGEEDGIPLFSQVAMPRFDDRRTKAHLAGSLSCPPIAERLLGTYLSYLAGIGYLSPPRDGGEQAIGSRLTSGQPESLDGGQG